MMDNHVDEYLNDIFEEEKSSKRKQKKIDKKEIKKKKKEEKMLEKIEDEEFLKLEKANQLEKKRKKSRLSQENSFSNNTQTLKRRRQSETQEEIENTKQLPIKSRLEMTRSLSLPIEGKTKSSFFALLYDTIFGFFLIIILLISLCYFSLNIYHKENIKILITNTFLIIGLFSYIISMIVKKEAIKKLFAIFSSMGMSIFIILTLYFS